MTKEQRQLRMHIRNCYLVATRIELERELAYRKTLNRSQFELDCFAELISEPDA